MLRAKRMHQRVALWARSCLQRLFGPSSEEKVGIYLTIKIIIYTVVHTQYSVAVCVSKVRRLAVGC